MQAGGPVRDRLAPLLEMPANQRIWGRGWYSVLAERTAGEYQQRSVVVIRESKGLLHEARVGATGLDGRVVCIRTAGKAKDRGEHLPVLVDRAGGDALAVQLYRCLT